MSRPSLHTLQEKASALVAALRARGPRSIEAATTAPAPALGLGLAGTRTDELDMAYRDEACRDTRLDERLTALESLLDEVVTTVRAGRRQVAAENTSGRRDDAIRVVSIVYRSQLPAARVLARSLAAIHPDWPLEVVLIGSGGNEESAEEPFTLTTVKERLGLEPEEILARHPAPRLSRWLVCKLLAQDAARAGAPVIHLPTETLVLADLAPLAEALRSQELLLVTLSAHDPPDDGLEPSKAQLLSVGRISSELIGITPSVAGREFIAWWDAQLERAYGPLGGGSYFASDVWDQWLGQAFELAAARVGPGTLVADSILSAWNAWSASLEASPDGAFTLDGHRVKLADLTGFDPDHPHRLGPHANRVRLSRSYELGTLTKRYRDALLDAGWQDFTQRARIGERLADATLFDERLWQMRARAYELGAALGDVFSQAGTHAFKEWLSSEPEGDLMPGISRYIAYQVYAGRPDLFATFEPVDATNPDFIAWCHQHGRVELGIPEWCLPAHPTKAAAPKVAAPSSTGFAPVPGDPSSRFSVRLTGYIGHLLGIGIAARGYGAALNAAGVPVEVVSINVDHPERPGGDALGPGTYKHTAKQRRFELVGVNPDELPAFMRSAPADYPRGPRIGLWAWETDAIPPRWFSAFESVDEVWVPSRYTADVLNSVSSVPVLAMAHPVETPVLATVPHRLAVPDGFVFLFMFDYFSTIERKNPIGLIEAFKKAFAPDEGPRLLIKTLNGSRSIDSQEAVLYAAADRPDIHVIDTSLNDDEKNALIAGCDCYVSLHRSEGFGLTMAEAMSLGKPVIGTGFSGNLDFMDEDNSLLVDYRLVSVGPDCPIYPPEGRWADPNPDHAASLMRQVYEDPAAASLLGERAREDVARKLSLKTRGEDMLRRLEQLVEVCGD